MWVHSLVSADLHFLQLVPSLQTYVVASSCSTFQFSKKS